MTYENCLKYQEEAQEEETREFWKNRIARKYPEKIVVKEIPKEEVEVKEEIKSKKKKK